MAPTSTTRDAAYLDGAERHTGRRLACRAELAAMLRAASDPGLSREFDRALFLARFWEGATGILRRTGPDSEEVARLTAELADAVGNLSSIIVRLLAAGAPDLAQEYSARYRPADIAGMERLSVLLADLAAIKEYDLHGEGR